jgi:hypothetical protein
MESIPVFDKIKYSIIRFRIPQNYVKNEEGKYVFVGKVYGFGNINDDFSKVLDFLENFTVLNQEELLTADDGVYNWILYSEKDSDDIKFAAIQIQSPFEIGTTHQSLAYNKKVNASLIYGAGELKLEEAAPLDAAPLDAAPLDAAPLDAAPLDAAPLDAAPLDKKITFNVLSGTYTYNIQSITFDFDRIVTRKIIDKFIELFPESTFNNSRDSYVHSIKTVSNKLLELYKKNGFIFRLFDEYNDWAKFSNNFWNIDFRIEYFKKKIDDKNENQKIMQTLYMESIESMINLLEPELLKSN